MYGHGKHSWITYYLIKCILSQKKFLKQNSLKYSSKIIDLGVPILPFIFIFMKEDLVKANIYWVRNILIEVIAAVYNQSKWTYVYLQRGINHSQMKLNLNDTTLYHRYKMFCYMVCNYDSRILSLSVLKYIVLLMIFWQLYCAIEHTIASHGFGRWFYYLFDL